MRALRASNHRSGGFTLLEVLLAVSIIVGLMLAVLYFYQQSANFRDQLLVDTERVSTARLVMDRLTAELRAVPGRCYYSPPLSGTATLLQFIKTDVPSRAAWGGARAGVLAGPVTDLRLVKYTATGDATNVTGLIRSEEPMVTKQAPKAAPGAAATVVEEPPPPPPLTEVFHYVNFRYYDGTTWRDSWNSDQLPRGIEVSLAAEAPSTNLDAAAEFPADLFQRVIFLPSSTSISGVTVPDAEGTDNTGGTTPAEPPPLP